jgi:GntR family transcriptional regulator
MVVDSLSIQIDKNSRIPIYFQLSQAMLALISSGSLKPGDALPSETDFSRHFNISPMTVRQAMSELVNQGYIRRERGRGTFVAPRHLDHPLDRLVSFTEDMQARQLSPGAKVLLMESATIPAEAATIARLETDTPMLRLKRLRLANGEPVGVHDAYLYDLQVTAQDLENTPSLYLLLAQRGIILSEGMDTIEATSASKEVADLLCVKPRAPLLQTTRFAWDEHSKFVEYVVALYRADLYHYRTRLRR